MSNYEKHIFYVLKNECHEDNNFTKSSICMYLFFMCIHFSRIYYNDFEVRCKIIEFID